MVYIVTYEPIGAGQTADHFRQKLRALGGFCPIHTYCWAISTDLTAVQLRDYLKEGAGASRIFVIRSGTEAAWLNSYGPKNSEWLKKHL